MTITYRAFFGDAEHDFTLTDPMVAELERITGSGIGQLFLRLVASQFHLGDVLAIIRLGLIGGGMAPQRAQELVTTYGVNQPFDVLFPLALEVVTARWTGVAEVAA